MFFLRPTTDFFGPNADDLRCPILLETPVYHVITDCGERVVQGINALSQNIASSEKWPQWQRWNGSIIYERLPSELKKVLKKTDFDKKGYIILTKIHICTKEAIFGISQSQRNDYKANYCQLPGCMDPAKRIKSLTTCAALAYRLIDGQEFDVRRHYFGKVSVIDVSMCAYVPLEIADKSIDDLLFAPFLKYTKELEEKREEKRKNSMSYKLFQLLSA